MPSKKPLIILVVLLFLPLTSAASVDNYTLTLKFDHDTFYADNSVIEQESFTNLDYPYIVSGQPAGIVGYGTFKEARHYNLSKGLVAYYPLDSGSGTTAEDESRAGNENDGTLQNSPTRVTAKIDNGLRFRESGYIEVGDSPSLDIDNSFTWSTWVRLENKTSDSTVFGKSGAYELTIHGNDIKIVSWGDDWFPSYTFPEREWTHIAVTGNSGGTSRKLYINGTQVASGGPSYTMDQSGNPLQVGRWPDQDGNGINGSIDDLRIYNRSLSQDEIRAIYRFDGGGVAQGDLVQFTQSSGSFLLPFTRGGVRQVEKREELVESRELLNMAQPSFNFLIPETPAINVAYVFNQTVDTNISDIRSDTTLEIENSADGFDKEPVIEIRNE